MKRGGGERTPGVGGMGQIIAERLAPATIRHVAKSPEYLAKVKPKEGDQFVTKGGPTRGELKLEFRRIAIASSDIHDAHLAAMHLIEVTKNPPPDIPKDKYTELRHPLYLPLLTALVVTYAKPFTDSDTLGRLKKKWEQFDDPALKETHEILLTARNEIFAHSDALKRNIVIHPPGSSKFLKGKEMKHVGYAIGGEWLPIGRVRKAAALTYDLGRRLQDEVQRLLEQLYEGMELPSVPFKLRLRGSEDDGL